MFFSVQNYANMTDFNTMTKVKRPRGGSNWLARMEVYGGLKLVLTILMGSIFLF